MPAGVGDDGHAGPGAEDEAGDTSKVRSPTLRQMLELLCCLCFSLDSSFLVLFMQAYVP